MSQHAEERYLHNKTHSPCLVWRFNDQLAHISEKKIVRIELLTPAVIHWTIDNWKTVNDLDTSDTKLGMHIADLEVSTKNVEKIKFTFSGKKPIAGNIKILK